MKGLSRRRPQGVRRPLQAGSDLSRQAAGQLGSQAAHRHLRPRGRAARSAGQHVVPALSGRGQPGRFITVATTRPETMLGDTGVAVHPEDDRYKDLVGRFVRLPIVDRLIPIVADEYSDPEKGTGAVKITPAHDFNDFEVGRRHDLPMINILDRDARINENAPAAYQGLDRYEARKKIVAEFELAGPARQDRAARPADALRRPVRRGHRALADRSVVRRCPTLGQTGHRGGGNRAAPGSCPSIGKTPISSGCGTSSPGASRGRSGGAIRCRHGTGRMAPISSN